MRKGKIEQFLEVSSIASIIIGLGLEVAGLVIPVLGFALIGWGLAYWILSSTTSPVTNISGEVG